jgi:hypothetical protein
VGLLSAIAGQEHSTQRIVRFLQRSSRGVCLIGEYFREGAILVVVFLPIESWRKPEGITTRFLVETLLSSLLLLGIGIYLDHLSSAIGEFADKFKGEHGT